MKAVVKLHKETREEIAEFESAAAAAIHLNNPKAKSTISLCCAGKVPSCLGFKWKWKYEEIQKDISLTDDELILAHFLNKSILDCKKIIDLKRVNLKKTINYVIEEHKIKRSTNEEKSLIYLQALKEAKENLNK